MNLVRDFILNSTPFLGLNPERIIPLIEKIKLDFTSYDKEEIIISPDTPADRLHLLVKGTIKIERSPVEGVKVSWFLHEGVPIDLPAMYSLSQRHQITARSITRVDIVSIDKTQFRALYENESIILLNLMNALGLAASLPPVITAGNTIGMWIQSLAQLGGNSLVRIDVSIDRIAEMLSLEESIIEKQINFLVEDGSIKWLKKENAIIVPPLGRS